ncbi:MAG: hypothetical protein V1904_05835 [Bacteroidota bacterium]
MNKILISSIIFLLQIFSILCSGQVVNDSIQCNNHYSPVIGEDGRIYLNDCWADKTGVIIYSDSLLPDSLIKKKYYKEEDPYTWYIHKVCTAREANEIIKNLYDDTYIYKHWKTGEIFRGNKNECKCLSSESKIKTIDGYREITKLETGDLVATVDKGDTVFRPILQINRVEAESMKYPVCVIEFTNRIKLTVSSGHPTADYKGDMNKLKAGDSLGGMIVSKVEKIKYKEEYTYDILPAGNTGTYWVNGIHLGSTLFDPLSPIEHPDADINGLLKRTVWKKGPDLQLWEQYPDSSEFYPFSAYLDLGILNEKYLTKFPPTNNPLLNQSCIKYKTHELTGKDSLRIISLYQPNCDYGFDPVNLGDKRPEPVEIYQDYQISYIDSSNLILITKNYKGINDTIVLCSSEKYDRLVRKVQSLVLSYYEAENINELTYSNDLLQKDGKPYTGKVMYFYDDLIPAVNKESLFEFKNGNEVKMIGSWLPNRKKK